MPESTITLDTQYYQKLCELIIQQTKIIDLSQDILEKNEKELELKNELIKYLKKSVELKDNRLKGMLKLYE